MTGGSGFIGSHVIPALLAQGAVVSTSTSSSPLVRWRVSRHWSVTSRDPDVVRSAVADDIEAVVHLAAATSVLLSVQRPARTTEVNVTATAELLERCRQVGVASFVFASTNAVAGPVPPYCRIDEQVVLRPLTPYGASKAAAEMLMSAYTAVYGVRCVPLRFTNVYGPGMTGKDSIVARIMRAALSDGGMTVYGAGEQVRDYVYVEDVAAAVTLAVQNSEIAGPVVIGAGSLVQRAGRPRPRPEGDRRGIARRTRTGQGGGNAAGHRRPVVRPVLGLGAGGRPRHRARPGSGSRGPGTRRSTCRFR